MAAMMMRRRMMNTATQAIKTGNVGVENTSMMKTIMRSITVQAAGKNAARRDHVYEGTGKRNMITFRHGAEGGAAGADTALLGGDANVAKATRAALEHVEGGAEKALPGISLRQFAGHNLESLPSNEVDSTAGELVRFFCAMYSMRRLELSADVLYKGGLIRGFCHLYDGQEAIVAGMESALTFNDSIVTSYRDHCTHLGRGGTHLEVLAELLGRQAGASGGVGGSMHMYKKAHEFYGGNGIVGAQCPIGAGLAFAQKYRGAEAVAVTMYGDGAANQGQLYEAFNIAALWSLPCIFVCENNHFAMGTSTARGAKSERFYTRGDYVPGLLCDGMDVYAVKQGFAFAKDFALENGPIVLELDTYRYHGHSMSDPGSTYRTRDEVSGIRNERDPIERVRKLILERELLDATQLKLVEKDIRKALDEDIKAAKASPLPEMSRLTQNIYSPGAGLGTEVTMCEAGRITVLQ